MKIGLDFDSVLADTMVSWVHKFNKKNGTDYKKIDIKQWSFWNDFGITHDEAKNFFKLAWEDWEKLQPTEPELSITTKKISELADVDIVSSVEESHVKFVKSWLDKNEIQYRGFNRSNKKEKLPYNLFIDDDPDLPGKLDGEKKCLVYHQQWNSHIENGNNVERIKNLNEAYEKIKNKKI